MDMIMENPVLWGVVFIVVLLVIITVISIIITKKRRKEVEEIEKMFPTGNMTSEDVQISMDRFKRERQKRKQKPRIHRERPTEAHPDEDKEIVVRDPEELLKRRTTPKRTDRSETEKQASTKTGFSSTDKNTRRKEEKSQPEPSKQQSERQPVKHKHSLLNSKTEEGNDKEKDHSLVLNKKTQKPKKSQENEDKPAEEKQKEAMDKKASRRLYKRSLLKPEKNEEPNRDSGNHPKASLIGSNASSGYNKDEEEQDQKKTPSRTKHYAGKSLFSKKHK